MTWCNTHTNINIGTNIDTNINSSNNINIPITTEKLSSNQILISPTPSTSSTSKDQPIRTVACYCPSCGNLVHVPFQDQQTGGINDLPGLPAGVKFDPTDLEIMTHLEAKVKGELTKLHPLLDEFIPTIEGKNGICYTHPEKLPGVSKDGIMRHFFHCPSKAYTTGTRKRRKVHTDTQGGETRWHKTGKTRPVIANGAVKGHKKILVLYTNYGRQKKPEKTNWVMHQYHLGENEEENDGEFVLSKVFYQTQPRQCGTSATTTTTTTTTSTELALDQHQNVIVNPFTQAPINFHQHQNHQPPLIIPYDHNVGVQQNRESPPQLIPNLVLQGDGSSIVSLSGARNS